MPKKLSYNEVKQFFIDNNCQLISNEYKSNKQKLTYICQCGHERISSLTNVKTHKQFLCKICNVKYLDSNNKNTAWNNNNSEYIHPKRMRTLIRQLEYNFQRCLKYRNDFLPENYNKSIKCRICKREKPIYLYFNKKNHKYNKDTCCKKCNNENSKIRRKKHVLDQIIKHILSACKSSGRRRQKKGREECNEFNLTKEYIYELIDKQNNKCYFSGRELLYEYNSGDKISIDRINCDKGYVKGNVNLVTHWCNQARNNLSINEFLELAKDVHLGCDNNIDYEIDKLGYKKISVLLSSAKSSSKKRNQRGRTQECTEFNLTKNDILELIKRQNNKCSLTGRQLVWRSKCANMASIDRIDSEKGYTIDNIHLVVFTANQARSNLTIEEFGYLMKDIYLHHLHANNISL